jgi:hypothetical protein
MAVFSSPSGAAATRGFLVPPCVTRLLDWPADLMSISGTESVGATILQGEA